MLIVLGEFGAGSEGVREGEGEGVWCDRWVTGLVGEMDEDRKAIVRKVSHMYVMGDVLEYYPLCAGIPEIGQH